MPNTRCNESGLSIRRSIANAVLLVESTRKKVTFSTQILDLGDTDPVLVFSLGYSF